MSDPKDESITHVFDQTNGVVDDLEGESGGTAAGDTASAAEREGDDAVPGTDRPQAAGGSTVPLRDDDRDDSSVRDEGRSAASGDAAGAAVDDDEHTYAVDSRGSATDTGSTASDDTSYSRTADDGYSGAPSVAARSAADDGRDEGSTRTERSTDPVDDASHTGRLADAYATGPADEVATNRSDSTDTTARDDDATTGGTTAAVAATAADADGDRTAAVDHDIDAADRRGGLGDLAGDDSIGHVFDQTNGVIDGIEGDSDGTADSDDRSAADRHGVNEPNPVGQQDAWHDDQYGSEDGRDRNP